MPYEGTGVRHTATQSKAAGVAHGAACAENGFVGVAFKIEQLDRFVRPESAAATLIDQNEVFEIQIGGIHEVPRTGNLATADVGAAAISDIYIRETDNVLGLATQALTGAVLNANWRKFGKVTGRDTSRTPQVLRVNGNGFALDQVRGTLP